MRKQEVLRGWRSVQQLTPDGAVESEETVPLERPVVAYSLAGACELGHRYFAEVERSTLRLVRPHAALQGPHKGATTLLVLGHRPALLEFAPAEVLVSSEEVVCRLAITGGLLARSPSGVLTLAQRRMPALGLRSAITGFYPRLAATPGRPRWSRPLYPLVQRRVHVWISRRFFRALVEGQRS
jgi:hypothetical protein